VGEVHVFEVDVGPALVALGERAVTMLRGDATKGSSFRLAGWILSGTPESTSVPLRRRLGELLPDVPDPDPAEVHELLRQARPDGTFAAEISDEQSLQAYLETPGSETLETLEFLGLCELQLRRRTAPLPKEAGRRVRSLMGKFEVYGRVFSRYDANLRKRTDRYVDLIIYALLSLVLLRTYDRTQHLNVLNTALKVNDLLVNAEEILVEPVEILATISALVGAQSRLEEWYEAQGFRLPADR
jgi:hypothetical protein